MYHISTTSNNNNNNHSNESTTCLDIHSHVYKYYDDGLYEEEQPCVIPNCNGIHPNIKIDISQSMIIHSLQNIKLSDPSSSSSTLSTSISSSPTPNSDSKMIHNFLEKRKDHSMTSNNGCNNGCNSSNSCNTCTIPHQMPICLASDVNIVSPTLNTPHASTPFICSKPSFNSSTTAITTNTTSQPPANPSITVTTPQFDHNSMDDMCEDDENFEYNDELNFLISNFDLSEEEKNKFMPYIY